MIAYVQETVVDQAGSALAVDLVVGATGIVVDWAVDFDTEGGYLVIGGVAMRYTAADADTITLAAPSPVAAAVADDVFVLATNVKGEPEEDYRLEVKFDADADETISCDVSSTLARWLSEGNTLEGLPVEVNAVPGGYQAVSFLGRTGSLDGIAIWNPHSQRRLAADTVPSGGGSGDWHTVTQWIEVNVDGVATSETDGSTHRILYAGTYDFSVQVGFSYAADGRRRLRVIRNGDPADLLYLNTAAPDPVATFSSFVGGSFSAQLEEEDTVDLQVQQTSSTDPLAFSVGRGRSFFSMTRSST